MKNSAPVVLLPPLKSPPLPLRLAIRTGYTCSRTGATMNILNFDSPISESSSVKISIQKQDEDIWRELNALKSEIKSLKSIIETDKKENKSKFLSIEKKISSRDAFATISDPCEIQITGLPIWDDDEDVLKNHIFTIFRVCGRPEYYSCIRSINYSSSVSSIRYGRANLTRSVVLKMCSKDVRNALINSSSLLHGLTLDDIFGIDSKESIRLSAVWPFETLRIYRKAKDVAAMRRGKNGRARARKIVEGTLVSLQSANLAFSTICLALDCIRPSIGRLSECEALRI
uniref:Uncharacterized protein n=1 Tax=Trichogramma kaykai TaxID=54128 RepID=A0ABD2WN91_9HYME